MNTRSGGSVKPEMLRNLPADGSEIHPISFSESIFEARSKKKSPDGNFLVMAVLTRLVEGPLERLSNLIDRRERGPIRVLSKIGLVKASDLRIIKFESLFSIS